MNRKAILFASIFSIFIGFFASLNFYYFTTGQIEDARSIFEAGGGDPKNFNIKDSGNQRNLDTNEKEQAQNKKAYIDFWMAVQDHLKKYLVL